MLHAKAMDDIKQQIYEASTMDNEKSAQETTTLQAHVSDLENENVRLRNETDSLEQYSRRNCLVFHGIPENEKDTTEAVVRICQSKLGLPIDRNCIDRSHRLDRMTGETSQKPRADTKNIINNLKSKRSMGIDNISSILLKASVNVIAKPLTSIINQSLLSGKFSKK